MQPAYGGYQPYTAQAPYPGQYYAPAGYTNGYPNGGTYPDPAAAYPAWQNAPQMAPATGQTPMARPQQLYDPQMPQRQPSNSGGTPMPRPKTLNTKTKPTLKSAMKTPSRSVSEPIGYGNRPRTQSDPHGTLKQFARARTNSVTARDIPDHLFFSIAGTSELRVQNVKPQLRNDLKQLIGTMWHPGIESEIMGPNHSWRVKFAKTPWSSVGTDAIMVLRMLNQFFNRIKMYYDFGTTLNAGLNPPRLVFVQAAEAGIWLNHFVAYFSRNGRKLTLVDPPAHVGGEIGARLRTAWPYKVELTDRPPDGGIYTVSLRGTYGSYDQHLFTSYALQEIRVLGFKLLATIPLAKRGSFGMGSRREVLVFQDMMIEAPGRPTQ